MPEVRKSEVSLTLEDIKRLKDEFREQAKVKLTIDGVRPVLEHVFEDIELMMSAGWGADKALEILKKFGVEVTEFQLKQHLGRIRSAKGKNGGGSHDGAQGGAQRQGGPGGDGQGDKRFEKVGGDTLKTV